jgi:hypothetical protein
VTAVWVAVLVALLALAYYGMWRGWHNRAKRQAADIPEPEWLEGGLVTLGGVDGTYVSTTTAGNWLDRVTTHGLGTLSKAEIAPLMDGDLGVLRRSARSFRIPASALVGARLERGIAGKVREPEGIVVITWRLGERELDTGFRPEHKMDAANVERLVERLMEGAHHG